jgi:hypothetical protein
VVVVGRSLSGLTGAKWPTHTVLSSSIQGSELHKAAARLPHDPLRYQMGLINRDDAGEQTKAMATMKAIQPG